MPLLPVMLLMHGRRAFQRQYLWFYILVFGWLFSTVTGDLYLGTSTAKSIKGLARVVFFTLDFMALAIMINNNTRRMIIFLLSIFVQMFYTMRSFGGEFLTQWKFGGSSIVTIVALLISSHFYSRRRYGVCLAIVLGVAGLNLVFAFRSQIATDFISAALTLPIFAMGRGATGRPPSRARRLFQIAVLITLAASAAYLANAAIKYAANHGVFDESTQAKFQTQAEGSLGVLVGGRPETLVAIQAIRDSPIIGHGSFAADRKYWQLKQDIQYEYGYTDTDEPDDADEPPIPTHSHLTQAWVDSGILGGIFWIYVLGLTLLGILKVIMERPGLSPLYSYLLLNFLWNVLYSPFGSVNRMWATYFVLMSYHLLKARAPNTLPADARQSRIPTRKTIVRLSRTTI